MKDIKSLTLSQLKEEMAALGEKPFRAKQLYEWMHVKLARDYGEMTNIPKSLIAKCRENYTYTSLKEVTVQTSAMMILHPYTFHQITVCHLKKELLRPING